MDKREKDITVTVGRFSFSTQDLICIMFEMDTHLNCCKRLSVLIVKKEFTNNNSN